MVSRNPEENRKGDEVVKRRLGEARFVPLVGADCHAKGIGNVLLSQPGIEPSGFDSPLYMGNSCLRCSHTVNLDIKSQM